jgi:NAD(P)-dependent dehydrogenase (short-subunit alcohol dehydrogenase family)
MDLGLKDKKVLITGSSKGIGLAAAEVFLREGARVWINARTQNSVNSALTSLKRVFPDASVQGIVSDVATENGLQSIVNALPHVDVLVNNAGIFRPESFFDIPRESWLQMFEVNVLSGARLTQKYLPGMLSRNWGRVIFISSESGISTPVEMVHYGMSKTAQLAVARGAAELTRGTKVTVNSVLPGPTMSDGVETFIDQIAMTEKEFFAKGRPTSIAQRFATSEEVANMIAFVASEKASMVNGAALRVDGGTAKVVF